MSVDVADSVVDKDEFLVVADVVVDNDECGENHYYVEIDWNVGLVCF